MKNALERLNDLMKEKNSRVCAGFDPVWEEIPYSFKLNVMAGDETKIESNHKKIIWEYGVAYIEAVKDNVAAIKINSAFFEKEGYEDLFFELAGVAGTSGLFVIGDVKRGDIGNSSAAYAEAYLGVDSPFDAITVNPYFGEDGVKPFIELAKKNNKAIFVLVKTANNSSSEIQNLVLSDGRHVYEVVADLLISWKAKYDITKYIDEYSFIGAVSGTNSKEETAKIVGKTGKTFILVPEYGVQGASAFDVAGNFDWQYGGAIVNSSKGIMQAYKKDCWKDKYSEETWAEAAYEETKQMKHDLNFAIRLHFERDRVK